MNGIIREMKIQNVYVVRLIRSVQMGILASGDSYIDKFFYEFYGNKNWDGCDVSWTQYFVTKMEEFSEQLKSGSILRWDDSIYDDFWRLIVLEDKRIWDALTIPMKKINDIKYYKKS